MPPSPGPASPPTPALGSCPSPPGHPSLLPLAELPPAVATAAGEESCRRPLPPAEEEAAEDRWVGHSPPVSPQPHPVVTTPDMPEVLLRSTLSNVGRRPSTVALVEGSMPGTSTTSGSACRGSTSAPSLRSAADPSPRPLPVPSMRDDDPPRTAVSSGTHFVGAPHVPGTPADLAPLEPMPHRPVLSPDSAAQSGDTVGAGLLLSRRDDPLPPPADCGAGRPAFVAVPVSERPSEDVPWWRRLSFVKPFALPDHVDWGDVSAERRGLGLFYADPAAAGQFRVFTTRTLQTSVVSGMFLVGSALITGLGTAYIGAFRWYNVPLTVGLLLGVAADVALHVWGPLTIAVATARAALSAVLGLLIAALSSWTLFVAATQCDEAEHYYRDWAGFAAVTKGDVPRCIQAVETIAIAVLSHGVFALALHPLHSAGLAALQIAATLLGRLYDWDRAEPWRDLLGVKLLIPAAVAAGSFAVAVLRQHAAFHSFDAVMALKQQAQRLQHGAEELEALVCTLVPDAVLPRLLEQGAPRVDAVSSASVLFADMCGFTAWAATRTPDAVASMLNTIVADVDALAWADDAVEKVKTIGDAYWAVAGIPVPVSDHAPRLVRFALGMTAVIERANLDHPEYDAVAWRVGVHSGPLRGAVFGTQQVSYEVFGPTCRMCQDVEQAGVPGAVCVTRATAFLLAADEALDVAPVMRDGAALRVVFEGTLHDLFVVTDRAETPVLSRQGRSSSTEEKEKDKACAYFPVVRPRQDRSNVRLFLRTRAKSSAGLHSLSHRRAAPSPLDPALPMTPLSSTTARTASETVRAPSAGPDSGPTELELKAPEPATPEDLLRRRFGVPLLFFFHDAALEGAYAAFASAASRPIAVAGSAAAVLFSAAVLASVWAQTNPCGAPLSSSLLGGAVVLCVAACVAAAVHAVPVLVSLGLMLAGAVSLVVGSGLSEGDGCTIGLDPAFTALPFAFFALGWLGALSWPLYLAFAALPIGPALVFTLRHALAATQSASVLLLSLAVQLAVAVALEVLLRRRFVEEHSARSFAARHAQLHGDREAVLAAVVPRHVIPDLVAWLGRDLDPARPVARHFPAVVVAFVRLQPLHPDPDLLDGGPREGVWLPEAHAAVDAQLEAVAPIAKIKTVGDVVLLAGPFRSAVGVESAADSTMAALALLSRHATLQVGLHVGAVMGTVQGTSRLSFDIFGDAVNTASRVMTGEQRGRAAATQAFVDALDAECDSLRICRGVRWSPVTTRPAKGKGDLAVRVLEAWPDPCDVVATLQTME